MIPAMTPSGSRVVLQTVGLGPVVSRISKLGHSCYRVGTVTRVGGPACLPACLPASHGGQDGESAAGPSSSSSEGLALLAGRHGRCVLCTERRSRQRDLRAGAHHQASCCDEEGRTHTDSLDRLPGSRQRQSEVWLPHQRVVHKRGTRFASALRDPKGIDSQRICWAMGGRAVAPCASPTQRQRSSDSGRSTEAVKLEVRQDSRMPPPRSVDALRWTANLLRVFLCCLRWTSDFSWF